LAQLEIPLESVERLAEICSQEQIPLMLDPAPARALSANLLSRVRWFTPNETEAKFYVSSGRNESAHQNDAVHRNDASSKASDVRVLQETARSLLSQGPAGILLKLGARGAYLAAGDIEREVKAMPVEVLDTTAAGDAFNGAFAVGLMLGKSLEESARFAVTAASISVTRVGAQPSMPTFAEVSSLFGSGL
ncbi:MAG: PfkB family carbohydrate kinase, partial [Acidobacteriaceae bacterium]